MFRKLCGPELAAASTHQSANTSFIVEGLSGNPADRLPPLPKDQLRRLKSPDTRLELEREASPEDYYLSDILMDAYLALVRRDAMAAGGEFLVLETGFSGCGQRPASTKRWWKTHYNSGDPRKIKKVVWVEHLDTQHWVAFIIDLDGLGAAQEINDPAGTARGDPG